MRCCLVLILLFSGTLAAQTKEAEMARSTYAEKIYQETVAGRKVKLYKRWLRKFPPADFPHSLALYDFTRINIAKAYVNQENSRKALVFADGILVDEVKPEIWFDLGNTFREKDFRKEAEQFLKMAWDKAYEYLLANKSDPLSLAIISRFPEYSLRLAGFLSIRKKEKEALNYIKPAFDRSGGKNSDLNISYVKLLMANGFDSLANAVGEYLVRSGDVNYDLRDFLFSLSLKNHGIDSAQKQIQKLNSISFNHRKALLEKEIMDIPAHAFTLSDLYGNKVSLSDFKGKTVILDFWATWCIPCIQSFPYLKTIVDSYKKDNQVAFLFIHTWEKANETREKAKKFMEENRYDFQVLLDLKDPVTEVNKVVEYYNIEALPAKVVIDRAGKIRLLKVANWKKEPSDGNAVEELRTMIELVKTLTP